jgi:hypothetical protein
MRECNSKSITFTLSAVILNSKPFYYFEFPIAKDNINYVECAYRDNSRRR